VAVITQDGVFTIFWLGASPEDSLESIAVPTYPEALAAAFDLDQPPRLKSVIVSPRQASERPVRTPEQGVRVMFRFRQVGLLRKVSDGWAVLDRRRQPLATLVSTDGGLWRLNAVGAGPEDSFAFDELDDLLTAVAVAFKLPGAPTLDPPITG
jgi:hypothetical protein